MFSKLTFRAWYYFRLGYSTYLTFILGYASTLVTVYYLAIRNIPSLLDIFPLSVGIGWIHLKRSRLFSSEVDIGVESNPYNYKLQPGKDTEISTPFLLISIRILKKLADTNGLLTSPEKAEITQLEDRLLTLLGGGYIGTPRRRTDV